MKMIETSNLKKSHKQTHRRHLGGSSDSGGHIAFTRAVAFLLCLSIAIEKIFMFLNVQPFAGGYWELIMTTNTSSDSHNSMAEARIEKLYKDPTLRAFDTCCQEFGSNKCTPKDQAWFYRMRSKHDFVKSGLAMFYWAHMRKAGGTTLNENMESARKIRLGKKDPEPTDLFSQGFRRGICVHLQAGSRHCFEHPSANETLFVTILRRPLDRYVSEYNYMNLGKDMEATTMPGRIKEWVDRNKDDTRFVPMSKARNHLIDNWQVRWYTNACDCKDLNEPAVDYAAPNETNYRYWNSGCPKDFRLSLSRQDLEEAKRQIDQYDIVGVAPYFEEGCNMESWFVLAGSNKPSNLTNTRKNASKKKNDNPFVLTKELALKLLDPKLFELDNELFEYAEELVRRRTNLACCVYNRVDAKN